MDIKSIERRSWNMSRIRSSNTKPELYIRRLLYARGYRYRVNYRKVIGVPDIYFIGRKVAIFIHGCFWHRHDGCRYAFNPKSNTEFWNEKFSRNIARDSVVMKTLEEEGIRRLVIWECTIKKMMKDEVFEKSVIDTVCEFIDDQIVYKEI